MTPFTVLDAPCNLGLRPPAPGFEPGVRRLADALRACGLVKRLDALDAGRVDSPAYVSVPVNRAALVGYTRTLADRIGALLDEGARPLVLGGDCSILLGAMLALRRRARHGLLHVDGHLDFRHPGWSGGIGAVAGEDLAGVTGRLEPELSNIDGLGPYVLDADTVHLGDREQDPGELAAVASTGHHGARPVLAALAGPDRPGRAVLGARRRRRDRQRAAARGRLARPRRPGVRGAHGAAAKSVVSGAVGVQVTVFDPDLDADGSQARALTDCLVSGLT